MKIRIDPLDKIFSEFVRLRSNGVCQRCQQYKGFKGLQCSHFIGRSNRAVRYDEDNAIALCFGCHQYFTSRPLEHVEFFMALIGKQRLEFLQARARISGKYIDKEAIFLYYKEKIKQLKEEE